MSDLTVIPSRFPSGTTVEFRRSYAEYPADDGWTLELILTGRVQKRFAGTADAADFTFLLTAAATGQLPAGLYTWTDVFTKAGVVKHGQSGSVVVTADIGAAVGDSRSKAEIVLDALNCLIEGRITKDQESIVIDGVQIVHIPIDKAVELRALYAAEVAALLATAAGGSGLPARIHAKFTRIR